MPKEIHGQLDAKGMRFAIVASRYNSLVTSELVEGALDALKRHGADPDSQEVIYVPGGWEIPLAVKSVLERGGVDGVIALGCVMKGHTDHNDLINHEVAKGIGQLMMQYGKPVTFGVLSPGNLEQALERAGLKMGNKGAECAIAAIEMTNVMKQIEE